MNARLVGIRAIITPKGTDDKIEVVDGPYIIEAYGKEVLIELNKQRTTVYRIPIFGSAPLPLYPLHNVQNMAIFLDWRDENATD